eukprot:scaffold52342_cov75-Phaeocystis_antarctica.AAC.3
MAPRCCRPPSTAPQPPQPWRVLPRDRGPRSSASACARCCCVCASTWRRAWSAAPAPWRAPPLPPPAAEPRASGLASTRSASRRPRRLLASTQRGAPAPSGQAARGAARSLAQPCGAAAPPARSQSERPPELRRAPPRAPCTHHSPSAPSVHAPST